MVLSSPCRIARRFRPGRGFTLVELITAASLMTIMMLGVVQIFGIITETASQAQGAAYALEEGRALMDALQRDIRGFDRLGYFKVQISDTSASGVPDPNAKDPGIPTVPPKAGLPVMSNLPEKDYTIRWYSSDCLALTTIGYFEGQKGDSTKKAAGAEVVYTPNVKTPDRRFALNSPTPNVDPRRGVLARAAWIIGPTGSPVGQTSNADDVSEAKALADLGSGLTPDRLGKPEGKDSSSTLAVSPVQVAPLLTSGMSSINVGPTGNVWQLRRVAACCLSEFMVEVPDTAATGTIWSKWVRRAWTATPISAASGASVDKECPRAIRVTIAIHDPSDRKPSTGPSGRFEGYALQEIFWISDP